MRADVKQIKVSENNIRVSAVFTEARRQSIAGLAGSVACVSHCPGSFILLAFVKYL